MKLVDISSALKILGWSISKDEAGDCVACYRLLDRTADIIYGLKKLPGEQQLWIMRSTSTDAFSAACLYVRGYGESYTALAVAWKGLRIQVPEIFEEHVRQASDEAIAWAQEQDLEKALREHASLPTNAPGARPIWHLAALALLGDVAKIKSYQASFEAGDRLGFVNYVTKDFIDRAVVLAEKQASGSL